MEPQEQRNFLIAMAAMIAFVFLYQYFVMEPAQKRYQAEQAAIAAATQVPGADTGVAEVLGPKPLEEALAGDGRVEFDADAVDGSIRLAGARIDDLSFKQFYTTVDRVEEIRLLRPEAAEGAISAPITGLMATRWWRAATLPGPRLPARS